MLYGPSLHYFQSISRPKIGLQGENQIKCILFSFGLFLIKRIRSSWKDESGWFDTVLYINLCTRSKQWFWCVIHICNLSNLGVTEFLFKILPFPSTLLFLDFNIGQILVGYLEPLYLHFYPLKFFYFWIVGHLLPN